MNSLPAGIYLFLSGLVGLGLIRGRKGGTNTNKLRKDLTYSISKK